MKLRYKGIIALAAIFVAAGVYQFALACDGTRGGSERKTMDVSGGEGFKKSCDQKFGGNKGDNGNHKGWEQGKHRGWDKAGHEGNRHGRHHQESTGENNQDSTGTDTGNNQSAADPTNTDTYPDSATLLTQTWNSYNDGDYATAKAFANEAISRYGEQAAQQQASLSGFAPEGAESQYWALNDVATSHFILGSIYKSEGNNTQARKEFNTIISDYKYAQAYDPEQDIYWKVAEGAQTELDNLPATDTQQSSDQSSGGQQAGEPAGTQQTNQQPAGTDQNMDFSQYTDSQSLLTQAWAGYNKQDWATAQAFSQETITRYDQQALEQQASLKNFAPQGQEDQYWALNDVATSYFILASAYKAQGDYEKAAELLNLIITKYGFAQCYDPEQDIYWKVAEAAQKELDSM